jgi:class 3 adenylate cyclase/tetratricopeptide (TPR) repeat protein
VTPSREQRKTVTVLFCDLTGSTALGETLDPERLRALLARYFERMKAIVERHGGTVEKFIGDAVMAVFGVPMLHEDDALRAVRSAFEMREVLPELGLQGRIGVMTGEVMTGTEERLATGDAVNVAARLEQSAQPGEVLIGQPTLALVRNATEVEAVEPLVLKGKAEPVPAFRLLRVRDAPERRHGARFVGRDHELAILREAWERVANEHRCELVTVIGDAGVGKSRLAAELLVSIESTVVSGRCPPYGEGITYWPVVEVLKQLDVSPPEEAAAVAIRSLLGESDAGTSAEEIAWAFRRTLEQAAADGPLVVVFDDIQWGEQTFHDLIEHLTLLSSDASILLLCMARPELTERRPTWPTTLRLEPLGDADVEELIAERVAGEVRTQIARAAGGNPLFIEEMLAMAGERDGEVVVPPTMQALLAARLDQLEAAERSVLERGSIEGEIFHRGAVQALAPEGTTVTPHLAALVRKEVIRPDRPQLAGEDSFRFRHILIRDAAYDALPKATRAELHARLASWLDQRGSELVELDEIVGYHLEQACRYRAELGMPDDEQAAAARRRLTAAGFRANIRQDYGAAVSLFERAAALEPATGFDLALETELGTALVWTGRGDEALRRADALAERAAAAGDRVGELCGRIQSSTVGLYLEPEGTTEKLAALIEGALTVFRAAGDDLALYVAYAALSELEVTRARIDAGLEAYERAYAHAQHAGHVPPGSFGQRAFCRFAGTTPVQELLAWLDENEAREGRDYFFRAYRAGALAMLGRFDEARAILAEARAELAERGGGILLANITAFESVWVELWAGDPVAAAEFGAEGFRLHEELGDPGFMSNAAGTLALAIYALDQLDEADTWARRAEELGSSDDADKEMLWRRVRAKVLARRGKHADGERLALEAVAICEETDRLDAQGDAYADLAEVLLLAGRAEEAAVTLAQAIERYERKGNIVSAQRARTRLAELRDP